MPRPRVVDWATNPTKQIISREDAQKRGLSRFFDGEPCAHGHVAERYVGNGRCAACQVGYNRARRDDGREARPSTKPEPRLAPTNPTPEHIALLRRLVEWLPAGVVGVHGPRFLARGWVESRQGAGGMEYRRSEAGDKVLRGLRRRAARGQGMEGGVGA